MENNLQEILRKTALPFDSWKDYNANVYMFIKNTFKQNYAKTRKSVTKIK